MKNIKFDYVFYVLIVVALLLFAIAVRAQIVQNPPPEIAASGGNFTLEKAVLAGGGDRAAQSPLNLGGTSGQAVSGVRSNGGSFSLYAGFWTPDNFTPTASGVVAGGQVKAADGRGIKNALVTVTFPDGRKLTVNTTSFGYYRFSDLPAGETYVFSISSKRFRFAQPAQIRNLIDDTQDIDFIAESL